MTTPTTRRSARRRLFATAALAVVLAVPVIGISDAVVLAHHPVVQGQAVCIDGVPKVVWTVTADAVRGYTWSVNGAAAKPDSQAFTFTNSQTTFTATGDWWNQQGRHVAGPEPRTGGPVALRTDCAPPTTTIPETTWPPTTFTTSTSSSTSTTTSTVAASSSTSPTTSTTTAPSSSATSVTTPSSSTAPPATTSSPTPTSSPSTGAEPSSTLVAVVDVAEPPPPPSLDGTLPATGRSSRQPATLAIGLLALGVVLALGARRRTVKL